MKKLFLIFCLSGLMGFSLVAFGATDLPAENSTITFLKSGSVVQVLYATEEQNTARIAITNSKGHDVYSEVVRTPNGFNRSYNLSGLPAGEYQVTVTDDKTSCSEKISVEKQNGFLSGLMTKRIR
ncbi:MAG: T9SS type A sorting domain-containing protein [Cyclobacteriaceae bacterium]|nr:T9SS type A sorting domain-containing protein [Cyclobacteriaceae bacterium]